MSTPCLIVYLKAKDTPRQPLLTVRGWLHRAAGDTGRGGDPPGLQQCSPAGVARGARCPLRSELGPVYLHRANTLPSETETLLTLLLVLSFRGRSFPICVSYLLAWKSDKLSTPVHMASVQFARYNRMLFLPSRKTAQVITTSAQ